MMLAECGMKKQTVIGIIALIALLGVFLYLAYNRIDGRYTCDSYTLLDGGVTESEIVFNNGVMTLKNIVNGVVILEKPIGTYHELGNGKVGIHDYNIQIKCEMTIGLFGIYMSDKDAARLGVRFPKIGNLYFRRKVY